MHELHEHLTQSLAERLKKRRVVTWYDPRREFTAYIAELAGGAAPETCQIDSVEVSGKSTSLCVMQESFFEAKFVAETCVAGDAPDPLLIYIPGKDRHDDSAILMELEAGGDRWEPQLKREARRVLKKRFGDGQIDQMLGSPNVTYQDIVGLLEGDGNEHASGSLLEVIYSEAKGSNAAVLAAWLAGANRDADIVDKGAKQELFQLIQSRLGLELSADAELEDARKKVCRYVLLGEFRKDLKGDPPPSLNMVSQPATKQLELVLEVAKSVRETHATYYVKIADDIQQELHLDSLGIAPEKLGTIDTFRFEEQVLLEHVGNLIVAGKFADAHDVVKHRGLSFWALHQLERQEQWQAYGLAAQLGMAVAEVTKQLPDSKKTVVNWTEGYVAENGWYRIDRLHRQLESTLAAMTDTIASEKVVHRVRKDYESLVDKMTTGFVSAFKESGWSMPGVLQQTQIYSKEVHSPSEVTCFILADALRYEMGVELMGLLENAEQLSIQPAIGSIPTITPIGMAALMPGAEESFSVVECGKDIGARINASVTGSLNDRRKVWKGKVPDVVDLDLDKVLSHSNSQLQKKVKDAPLLIVRSVEIDAMGEGGNTFLARQVMDTAINNVARAIKRLAGMGISRFVVAADHGHLFIHERDESERIEKPGGEQVSLHRRCWTGRGGSTPPSTVRISASQLGYDSDLDFVFPTNNSVFKAGGDLAYYHGGLSLQELLVPVLSIRMPAQVEAQSSGINMTLTKVPEKIANRIVTFGVVAENSLFSEDSFSVRPVLLHNGQHVGHVGMVLDAEHEASTQTVRMKPGTSCTVGVQLLRDDVDSVEIVVLDPETDRILAKSNKIPVKLGI
ncbi:MAG: PglZ domain-containing protein [Planctomycetales bacterium]|nr:PglZ domain-containing protein [Planctomycetales bacterium]